MSKHQDEPLGPQILFGTSSGALFCLIALVLFLSRNTDKIPRKRGIPVVGSWTFFTARHRFVTEGVRKLGNIFTFNVLHHQVVVVAGEAARQVFFGHKDMDFTEGYSVLHGDSPTLKDIDITSDGFNDGSTAHFNKRLAALFRRERLSAILPLMFQDLDRFTERWGTAGSFNAHEDVYNMVFQLTIRAMSCHEVADDIDVVSKVTQLYWNIEEGSTASSVLLPWLPSKARTLKKESTKELYLLFKAVCEDRYNSDEVHSDALQVLIDEGDSVNDAIQFMMSALFAGIVNTGIMSAWTMLYLLSNPTWKAKATEEIRSFIAKYAKSGRPLADQLAEVPPHVWDEEMPVLDVCLRETIRIVMSGPALRRNFADGIVINGHEIPRGAFMAFPMTSTHHDPNIYPDPFRWDPERYARNEDKKEHWAYLGWGTGRHPCSGMRFAKLEVKTILALFLTRYEAEIVDKSGSKVTEVPSPERNSSLSKIFPSQPVYVKYRRVSD
ncbi:cytochrome P450 [Rickenella mellea]|uniref:Cytochrome P450 n=1 Tax=Rickenella mellea TaxID=50990 RepID=A0A4Y7PZ72_9AGAM|nr:cytochrome P450 [Rickenella mellea]